MGNINSSQNEQFYANACHVCRVYGKDVELKRCANCKMIAYCSREHQKEHWPRHKGLCQALSVFIKFDKIQEFFGLSQKTKESWQDTRVQLVSDMRNHLGRELYPFETKMLAFQRCCEICHETDSLKLRDCEDCPDASFCTEHPKNDKHLIKCRASNLYFQANNMNLDLIADFTNLFSLNYGKSIPKNMDEVIGFFELFCPVEKTDPTKELWLAMLASQLTRVYTFLYSMEKILWPKLAKLRINVIGASREEMKILHYWQYLFHHDESLEELEIVFVGPELSNAHVEIKLCEKCNENNRKINILSVGALYEHFVASPRFTIPDYVIGFNLRIDESFRLKNDTWSSSIRILSRIGCPFFMTSSRFAEGLKKDQDRIDFILDKKIRPFWTGENPFPGRVPFKEFPHDDFSYDNQYLAIYKTLA